MQRINKARYWTGVLYPENMREDWQTQIGDIVQVPYAYCKHTQDRDSKSEHRKDHVHLMLAFGNTTTYQHAMSVFGLLSAEGKTAINKCEAIINVRNVYDYLIHDTESCRKAGKELYDKSERITGNNFDIGSFEQLSAAEKNDMCKELCNVIVEQGFTNFADFYVHVITNFEDSNYFEVIKTYSGLFERLTKGNYQKMEQARLGAAGISVTAPPPQNLHRSSCPHCGSFEIQKRGKTQQNQQRWLCKDCGKSFV